MIVLMIKNGAKGISVFMFIFRLEKNIIARLTIAPIQNESVSMARVCIGPSIQPIPKISFASPRPIHLPRDTSHKRANGKAKSGPDTSAKSDGITNKVPTPV